MTLHDIAWHYIRLHDISVLHTSILAHFQTSTLPHFCNLLYMHASIHPYIDTDIHTYIQTDRPTDTHTHTQLHRYIHTHTNKQINKQTDGQAGTQAGRQADRQRHTDTQTHRHTDTDTDTHTHTLEHSAEYPALNLSFLVRTAEVRNCSVQGTLGKLRRKPRTKKSKVQKLNSNLDSAIWLRLQRLSSTWNLNNLRRTAWTTVSSCRYRCMISSPFPHHTVASLRQVGMMSLTPLHFALSTVKTLWYRAGHTHTHADNQYIYIYFFIYLFFLVVYFIFIYLYTYIYLYIYLFIYKTFYKTVWIHLGFFLKESSSDFILPDLARVNDEPNWLVIEWHISIVLINRFLPGKKRFLLPQPCMTKMNLPLHPIDSVHFESVLGQVLRAWETLGLACACFLFSLWLYCHQG